MARRPFNIAFLEDLSIEVTLIGTMYDGFL
jgi:hypothetical protein